MSQPANDDYSQHLSDDEASYHEDASDNGTATNKPKQQQQQLTPTTTTISNIKLPILKKEEYDIWAMEMEHYLEYIDNDVWKVIQNGNSKKRISTRKEKNGKEGKNHLTYGIPKEHLRRFHGMDDAKEIWEAIRTRFGGNANSKKMQKAVLKQQFEAFSISSSEGLEKGYDRFQQLLSQLEAHGAEVSTKDANHKFLRSLPPAWSNLAMTMRTKPDVDTLSIDDLYNNLRVFEQELTSTSKSSASAQNVAFVSHSKSSTNKVKSGHTGAYSTYTPTSSNNIQEREVPAGFADEEKALQGTNVGKEKGLLCIFTRLRSGKKEQNQKLLRLGMSEFSIGVEQIEDEEETNQRLWQSAQILSRFSKTDNFKGVPHPLTRDYTPKPQEEIDDSFEGSFGNPSEHSSESESESISVPNEMSASKIIHHKKQVRKKCEILKELRHFNLFSISQICDKKHKVLFTETECLVVSPDFKMPDENQILLKVPRQNNMYSFDMKTPGLTKDYACLIAKATSDESKLWHMRVKIIRSDNGTEFKNRNMLEFYGNKGIKQEYSNARTPQQNEVAERMKQYLLRLLDYAIPRPDHFLPTTFWRRSSFSNMLAITSLVHQAPRAWYATLSTFLEKHGYRRGTIDKTLFIKKDKKDIMLVQVYVDDIIFGSTRKSWCDEFEALMKGRFQMSSMGELIFFLGLQVKQKTDGIFISQDKYVADMLKKFDLASVKTAITPMETKMALTKDEEADEVDVHLYRSMIGSLMYLTASRPDIMFAVCACSRFQVTPKTSHLNAVKRIFKYLKGKPNLGLWYPRESSFDLEAFSDSDYAGANLDRKSTTGGCQFLGSRLISWQCKKQTIVATSTTEAEYVAAASCCGQVLWIQNQMLDYGFNFMNTKIHIDNESTICIVKNPVYHSKTKHIEIRHHFIRDSYEKKLIRVEKIHTDFNVADLLTKAFDGPRFNFLVVNIGMINP
ncbi:putative ribonuclease H-like domain-containing protein [Tanacetum coccineum]